MKKGALRSEDGGREEYLGIDVGELRNRCWGNWWEKYLGKENSTGIVAADETDE